MRLFRCSVHLKSLEYGFGNFTELARTKERLRSSRVLHFLTYRKISWFLKRKLLKKWRKIFRGDFQRENDVKKIFWTILWEDSSRKNFSRKFFKKKPKQNFFWAIVMGKKREKKYFVDNFPLDNEESIFLVNFSTLKHCQKICLRNFSSKNHKMKISGQLLRKNRYKFFF